MNYKYLFFLTQEFEPRSLGQRNTNHRLHQVKEYMKTGKYPPEWGRADRYALRKFAARFQLIGQLRSSKIRLPLGALR